MALIDRAAPKGKFAGARRRQVTRASAFGDPEDAGDAGTVEGAYVAWQGNLQARIRHLGLACRVAFTS